jgi:cytochrome c biogenesis protein CcmG/thiol:disulfide interchange protein DsbE
MVKKLLLVIPFLILCAILFRGLQLNPQELPTAKLGQKVPAVMVHDSKTNTEYSISHWYGKPFVIHFFASWCDNCEAEMPTLLKWQQQHQITMIGVDYKDTPEAFNKWWNLWGNGFTGWMMDQSGAFGFDLGVVATPETFLVDASGVVRYRYQGPLTDEVIDSVLQAQWEAIHAK